MLKDCELAKQAAKQTAKQTWFALGFPLGVQSPLRDELSLCIAGYKYFIKLSCIVLKLGTEFIVLTVLFTAEQLN